MSRSPSPVIRRATRTYGRRRDTSEHDISFDIGNTSIESREDSLSSTSLPLDHELPPSSDDLDASNTSYVSARAEDADDSDNESPDEGAERFQFAWRAGLNKIDADEYESSPHPTAQDPLGETSEGIPRVPTRPASPTDQATQDAFGGTLSSLTATAQSSSLIIHKRAPRRLEALPPSEPESEAELHAFTPQTSPRHPINTPQTRSSPTPPTSIEMSSNKGKGKQREGSSLALSLESADDLPSNAKPATAKRQKKPKASGAAKRVKAPTKKEQIETRKATARITAQQTVAIQPAQQSKYPLSEFLQRLQPTVVATLPSRSKSRSYSPAAPLPSDPIQAFSSSPAADRHSPRPTASSSKGSQREFQPTGLLGGSAAYSESSSEEEFPDAAQLYQEKEKARKAEENKRRAQELKAKVVAQQSQPVSDSEDDLLIKDDPKNVARDEAQSRRGLTAKGVLPSRSRQKHLTLARTGPRESKVFLMDEEDTRHLLETNATPSFLAPQTKGKGKPVQMDPKTLNMILLAQDDKVKVRTIKEKEEDYKRRGGRIKERPDGNAAVPNPQEALQRIVERGRAVNVQDTDVEMIQDSGSDEEYQPEDAAGRDGSEDSEEENDEDGENAPPLRADLGEQADDEDDDNPFLAPRPHRPVARRAAVAVLSDDEEDSENRPPPSRILVRDSLFARPSHSPQAGGDVEEDPSLARRRSMSSLGDQTEDGTDKENDVRLSFDRGDDKENTVIAVQSPGLSLSSTRGFGSLFAAELQASPLAASRSMTDGVRSPLKELPADEEDEDPFMFSPGPLRLGNSTPGPAVAREGSPLNLNLSGGGGLQEAFSLSGKGKERAPSPSPLPLAEALPIGAGGFSQFFTQEGGGGFEKLKAAQRNDDISLTLEPGMQPVLEVDQSLAKKADEIFEKEQELAVKEQLVVRKEPTPEMFVDENGFLTQTRPELRTPMSMMTPSQPVTNLRLSSPATLLASVRKPLAPLLTQGPDDDDDDLPRRRLKKRDRTPPPQASSSRPKNAFEVLGRRPPSPKAKRPAKSAYIEGEAEESDEDAAFGFGGKRQDDDEEDSDDDAQDQPLPGLVDDKEMDDQTLAQQAVLEKHREHEELDDKAREKAARDAATGKLRVKRRDRGIGFEDSDSDEGSDDGRRARPANKKPRLNDSIAALSKDKETAPFALEYSANVDDDDKEFAYLKQDDMEMDVQEPEEEEEEPREVISHAQLREEMLQRARENEAAPVFNPHDVSRWDDGSEDEMDSDIRVKEVSLDQRRDAAGRLGNDADEPNRREAMGEVDRRRMAKWVKAESGSRAAGILGRSSGGSAAVTGHGKAKAGSGSFKEPRAPASSSASTGGRSKVAKAPSVLSAVSSRRAKFAN
ncbi:hypothetical protein VTO73DRAFT_3405 [Trametes versicolor]